MNASEPEAVPASKDIPIVQKPAESKPRTSRKRASIKAVAYVANRQKGLSKADSAREAGYSEETALTATRSIEGQPAVRDLLENAGLTEEKLLAKVAEGLEATKLYGKEAVVHPDYSARHKYVVTGLQMHGLLKEQPEFNTQVNIITNSEKVQQINQNFIEYLHNMFGGKK